MADSDKTLIGDGNLSNNNRKSSAPSIVPPSAGTVHSDTHPTHHVAMSEPSTLKRKQTSFQITSVTVKGSRLSTDGGEDSADDLDESHTEDASSDILDCSRTTDVDNDQLSEECSNINNDESSVHAPSIPVICKTELPVKQDAQNNANKFPSESSKDEKTTVPSERNQSQHVVNPPALPDQWQHRFRVVKIVSSEPFKRGRWLCMDFMDPPAPAVEAKPEVSESTTSSSTQMISSTCFPDTVAADRVAHIYEISPSDAYPGSISVAVGPDHIQQPMYGIFLPVNNGQYPFISGVNTTAAISMQKEVKQEPSQPATSTARVIQQSQLFTTSQTTFTEAQPQFPCQQTQVATTTVSQKPVQPSVTVQVITQHQSQTTVKAPTPATSIQQPVVSAPVVSTPTLTPVSSTQSAIPPQSQVTPESQITMQQRVQPPVVPQSHPVPISTNQTASLPTSNATLISSTSQVSDLPQTVVNPQIPSGSNVSPAQTSSVGTQASAAGQASNIPEVTIVPSIKKQEPAAVPSQVIQNHAEVKELGTPPSTNPQSQELTSEVPSVKSDINGEDSESVPSGTSTVAIDNKIEQAMDLVKSHLMFAVREEVDVLKEKITELMDRISQLEYENGFLRANASQQTLEQLNQTQLLQQQQQQNQPSTISINSLQATPQPTSQQQLNIQNPQSTS